MGWVQTQSFKLGENLRRCGAQTLRVEVISYRYPKGGLTVVYLLLGVQLLVAQLFFVQLGSRSWGVVKPKRVAALANEQSEV